MPIVHTTYTFFDATTPPPSSQRLNFDGAAPYTAVSIVWVHNVAGSGLDIHAALMAIPIGTELYIQDRSDQTLFADFLTSADPVDHTTYVELPVTWQGNGGALVKNKPVELVLITASDVLPWPGTPTIVTLDEAKEHLRVTTTARDADLQAKLDAATAIILDYCNTTAWWRDITPTWDSMSVPLQVKHAILLELGELDRFRGDDAEAPPRWDDHDLAPAIVGLLRRSRDPVVG